MLALVAGLSAPPPPTSNAADLFVWVGFIAGAVYLIEFFLLRIVQPLRKRFRVREASGFWSASRLGATVTLMAGIALLFVDAQTVKVGLAAVMGFAFIAGNAAEYRVYRSNQRAEQATPAMPVAVPAAPLPAAIPEPEPRVMCPLSPAQLIRLYNQGATELVGQSLVDQYMTQWRTVSATVNVVTPQNAATTTVTSTDTDGVTVVFFFDHGMWAGRLFGKVPGDPIKVTGRIFKMYPANVMLDECELVESDDAATN